MGISEAPIISLVRQVIFRLYIKSSIWHYIFVFFATFLDDEKICRNYVDPGTKRAKTAKIVSAGQKWARLDKEYLQSDWMTLRFEWQVGEEVIYPLIKDLLLF